MDLEILKKLTFKQAEGLEPIPGRLDKTEFPPKLRAKIWQHFYEFICKNSYYSQLDESYKSFLKLQWVEFYFKDITKFSYYLVDDYLAKINNLFLEKSYDEIFEYLLFLFRNYESYNTSGLIQTINATLSENFSPWKIIGEGKDTCIISVLNDEELQSVDTAYSDLKKNGYEGAKNHLVKSLEFLKDGKWNDSIRESIHAVEATANNVMGEKTNLNKILPKMNLHTAMKQGCEKLYAWTNDENGVRHAEIGTSTCDQADAQFMLGACSSFVSYMINKNIK